MKSVMFKDDAAKARIREWFDTFRAAIPCPTESRVLETPEGRTHVLVAGPADGPPLVCFHGALASSAHLLPELAGLVASHRVYAVDVVGQSVMSEDRRIDVRDGSYGAWARHVLEALRLRRAAVLGVSWGGFVALQAARAAPERVSALVLVVPAGIVAGPVWAGFTEIGWPLLLYRLAPSPARLHRLVGALFTGQDERWTSYLGDAFLSYRLDMRVPPLATPEQLAAYRGPVLVLGGDADVHFPGAALAARARELFPQAEAEVLAGCKHSPPTDEAFRAENAARIGAFLARAAAEDATSYAVVA